jgi:catechol 2,3-dioxygenase
MSGVSSSQEGSSQAATAIDPALRIAAVELAVADLDRSIDFYERVLGLRVLERQHDRAQLGPADGKPALSLTQIAQPVAAPPASTGLFHVAWLHRTRAALADSLSRLAANRWPLDGASDHGVSEALYLSDPDGLGIELYADRPAESWRRGPGGRGVVMYTIPLDLEDLLAQASTGPTAAVEPGTSIGHVHLKVADVPRAAAFYRDTLGFAEQASLPSASFLAAGGYHHHIGVNSWQSRDGGPPPENSPGLRMIDFQLSSQRALQDLAAAVESSGAKGELEPLGDADGVWLRDPDSQLLSFTHR